MDIKHLFSTTTNRITSIINNIIKIFNNRYVRFFVCTAAAIAAVLLCTAWENLSLYLALYLGTLFFFTGIRKTGTGLFIATALALIYFIVLHVYYIIETEVWKYYSMALGSFVLLAAIGIFYEFKSRLFALRIFVRYVIHLLVFLSLLALICCLAVMISPKTFGLREVKYSFMADHVLTKLLTCGGTIVLIALALKSYFSKNRLANYASAVFVLYLRSFKSDNEAKEPFNIFPLRKNVKIMKIGNPSHVFGDFFSGSMDTLFLPSTNWQKHVSKYIGRAMLVFIECERTTGILWEMNNHPAYLHKMLFHIPNKDILCWLLENSNKHSSVINEALSGISEAFNNCHNWEEFPKGIYFFMVSGNEMYTIHYSRFIIQILRKYVQIYPSGAYCLDINELNTGNIVEESCFSFKQHSQSHTYH